MDSEDTKSALDADLDRLLALVARSLRSTVTRCNEGDVNVTRTEIDCSGRAKIIPAKRFTQRVKANAFGHTVEVTSNDVFLRFTIVGQFSKAAISINRADRIMLTKETGLTIAGGRFHVYASDRAQQCHGSTVLDSLRAQDLVASIISGGQDSVHFYANEVVCYLFQPKSPDIVLRVIRDMISLADLLELKTRKIDQVKLPAQFSDMAPLADRWCISDDIEREEAIEAASYNDLRILIANVKPRLADIDNFLNAASGAADESAALGTLAECAVEAEIFLAHHTSF